ncbi:hypothetical protein Tco_0071872 [Tanacetum coccineum]
MLLPATDHREDVPKADVSPQKRLCLTAPTLRFEIGEISTSVAARQAEHPMSRKVGYEITNTWDEFVEAIQEIAPTTLEGINQRVTELATIVSQDTHKIDRRYHLHTTMLLDSEARHARQAWSQAMDCNRATSDARIGSLETLVATLMAKTSSLQTQLNTALGRIHTLEAREPARTDDPEDADSSA